jgi:hypothetical protein
MEFVTVHSLAQGVDSSAHHEKTGHVGSHNQWAISKFQEADKNLAQLVCISVGDKILAQEFKT